MRNIDTYIKTLALLYTESQITTQNIHSGDFVKELLIPFPSRNIQQKTVAYLDEISKKIEKIKEVQKEKMKSLVALKASILDQAFKRKL